MLSLVLTFFLIHVAIHLINTVGATTIDNLLWILYLKLPTSTSRQAREAARLKREALELKRDMNNTSSQDEFAKWAKLRRRHDKTMEEYEASSTSFLIEGGRGNGEEKLTSTDKALSSQKSSFDWAIKIARWVSTSGLKLFLQFRYNSTPVFVLPPGWFPYYVEWVLSFPKAPMGSVSVQVWSSVCGVTVRVLAEILSTVMLWVGSRIQQRRAVPVKAKKTQ
ncbi:guided entry of tail-anchored proteins factor 1 [Aspergillus chevalieri]|uniref:GET complex subunit get1 n=1 Tax=Aspergillus chevalieri TaxID=182096 RepID=A0A7R7ZL71_ASPCH|nr:GET complex subunit get1 [Aspergillus chevalieri]BCR85086.1 GET complex subunit get1 [Aspergillus chevalieri]